MHLLRVETGSLDDTAQAVDLEQSAAPLVFLSFTDSDLAALAQAWQAGDYPNLRLAKLADLKHPYSVDLWIETVASRAKVIVVRLLGGMDYWRYGVEQLSAAARNHNIQLAFIPGDFQDDARLVTASTLPAAHLEAFSACFRNGGPHNMAAVLEAMAQGGAPVPQDVEAFGEIGSAETGKALRGLIIFYRSSYLADDFAPVEALRAALQRQGFGVSCVYVSSLKDPAATAALKAHLARFKPDVIFNSTAFSAKIGESGSVLDLADAPVLQVILAGSTRELWRSSSRALSAADQAMNVVLPEVDGRIGTRAISFKSAAPRHPDLQHELLSHTPDKAGLEAVAALGLAWARLRKLANSEKRLALVLSDYPAKGGRTGYAVGLDTPQSVVEIGAALRAEAYDIAALPDAAQLMQALTSAALRRTLTLEQYQAAFTKLPEPFQAAVMAHWGPPQTEDQSESFKVRLIRSGKVFICVQPERGRADTRKGDYHDTNLPPCHSYIAFYLWLQGQVDALVHVGAHGTLEWLPGKAVALSEACAPAVLTGSLPVIYPFIVNNPGEAAQAKRRLSAVMIGHMTPPLTFAGTHGALAELEALMDEYAQAQTLDQRRARHLAAAILSKAKDQGLLEESGTDKDAPADEALASLDNWLCDIKDMRIGDGLHIFGQGPCGVEERAGLLTALLGRFVLPGPAGAPVQGRQDVLPTGRNLFSIDPRAIPSRTAWDIGQRLAQEVLETYAQEHGNWPKSVFLDLWASTSMRTGGDDLAQAFAFLGVKPKWDDASTRVNGFEIMPLAKLGRARVDVTLRISGLFRDCFPMQIALFDAAVKAVAALDEAEDDNPLVAKGGARIFGSAPGTYGLGLGKTLNSGAWETREDLGRAYLAANSYAYGGGEGEKTETFGAQVAASDAFVHVQDMAGQDVLDSDAFALNEGGFAAAAATLGKKPQVYHADMTGKTPKVRRLEAEVARVLRARATNPKWIEGQMRHGQRGAGEIAETVENLFNYSALSGVVSDAQFDAMFDATLGNEHVCAFLIEANAPAARAIEDKFREALRRGLWTCRRNSVLAQLAGEVLP